MVAQKIFRLKSWQRFDAFHSLQSLFAAAQALALRLAMSLSVVRIQEPKKHYWHLLCRCIAVANERIRDTMTMRLYALFKFSVSGPAYLFTYLHSYLLIY